jgi:hypothetical protein
MEDRAMAKQMWTMNVAECRLDHAAWGPFTLPHMPIEVWKTLHPSVQVSALHGLKQKLVDKTAGQEASEHEELVRKEYARICAMVTADDWNEKRGVSGGAAKITLKSLRENWSSIPDPFVIQLPKVEAGVPVVDEAGVPVMEDREMSKAEARVIFSVVGITLP